MTKKRIFTDEELKALYSDFLDRNCDPAPEAVSEAYTVISKAQEDYLCALEEYQFREVFMYGYELGMKSAEGKGSRMTYPINEQERVATSQQKGSVMKIAEIQKMVMIPEERYDRMLESYDKAVNTTGKLVKEVSAMQAELDRRTIIENEAILLISNCRFLEAMELLATI